MAKIKGKRTEEEKMRDRERMEKCIFGMHLAKAQKKWVTENNSSNDKFAKFLLTTPKTKNRAIAGTVTSENMASFAEALGCDVLVMKEVSARSILELVKYRMTEDEHRRSAMLSLAMLIFVMITVFTNNIGPTLLMIILSNLFLHNVKNIWNIKVDVTKKTDGSKSKLMLVWDVIAVISAIILIILVCFI